MSGTLKSVGSGGGEGIHSIHGVQKFDENQIGS